jgi:hypothetical protein
MQNGHGKEHAKCKFFEQLLFTTVSYVFYRNGHGFQGKNTVVVSTSGSSERFWLSLGAVIF